MNNLLQDLRYGLRTFVKKPAYTAAVVLTLALGIGANTAIFSVIDAVMLRPLPFANADRLVEIYQQQPGSQFAYPGLGWDAFQEWRGQNQLFEQVEAYDIHTFVLTGGAEPEDMHTPLVSTGLFAFLGVKPQLGRLFLPEDGEPGNNRVVLIGDGFWKRHFGASPEAIGKTLILDDQPYTVVGVMPPGFKYPYGKFQLWSPLVMTPMRGEKQPTRFHTVARLREGVPLDAAQSAINAMSQTLTEQKPNPAGWGAQVRRMGEIRINPAPRRALFVLLGAVGFVLLLACLNAANLLLSRGTARQREIAIRSALGASRFRIVRQLLTESAVMAALGGCVGVLLALWGVDIIVQTIPSELTFLSVNEISVDKRVLAFTVGLSALTGILFGLVPAIRISRTDLQQSLKGATRSATDDRAHSRLRSSLVIVEVAFSLVLLIGAGLMIKSFLRLSSVPPGFDTDKLLAATIAPSRQEYPTLTHIQDFFGQVKSNIAALPGVESVAVAAGVPPKGGGITFNFQLEIEGRPPEPVNPEFILPYNQIEADYFQVMGIPLLEGRPFGEQDVPNAPGAIIINDQMARHYWPGESAVSKRLRFNPNNPWLTVVGVAEDVRVMGLDDHFGAMEIYYPYSQATRRDFQRTVIVRTRGEPDDIIAAVKGQIWAIDKDQPIYQVSSVNQLMYESLDEARFYLIVMILFAGVAALLVGMGIYSVLSYLVSQRTHEIGIRMALGAGKSDVLKLVIGQGMAMALIGIAIGIGASYGLTRLMQSLLFDVSATDTTIFIIISALLATVAFLACYIPARRATRVDPIEALRYE